MDQHEHAAQPPQPRPAAGDRRESAAVRRPANRTRPGGQMIQRVLNRPGAATSPESLFTAVGKEVGRRAVDGHRAPLPQRPAQTARPAGAPRLPQGPRCALDDQDVLGVVRLAMCTPDYPADLNLPPFKSNTSSRHEPVFPPYPPLVPSLDRPRRCAELHGPVVPGRGPSTNCTRRPPTSRPPP